MWAAAKNRYRPLERFSFARLKPLKQLREYFTRYASLKRRINEIHTAPQGKLFATTLKPASAEEPLKSPEQQATQTETEC